MEDFPVRLADFLESVAIKVRALTIDRVRRGVGMVTASLPLAVLVFMGLVFLVLTIHRSLAIPLGQVGAFGIEGGLFVVGGALVWRMRNPKREEE
ncbi:MAG: hypothetical protein OEY62_09240 [Acidimicrobiia bacterium]|nr:hypothetical protein [Acidimicrobiia bacterium]